MGPRNRADKSWMQEKNMMKRILMIVLAAVFLLTAAAAGEEEEAAYHPEDAIAYARIWGGTDRNPEYKDLTDIGDCANFVSQCMLAGGIQTTEEWQPYTYAWKSARGMRGFLKKLGYPILEKFTVADIEPGDIIFGSDGVHVMIVVEKGENMFYYCGHTSDRYWSESSNVKWLDYLIQLAPREE